jgi:hypothetical protein
MTTMTGTAATSSHGAMASVWMFCASCRRMPQLIAGGLRPEAQEAQRRLADDHGREAQSDGRNHVAHERGQHVAKDDAHLACAHQLGGHHEIFLAQRQEAAAHTRAQDRSSRSAR